MDTRPLVIRESVLPRATRAGLLGSLFGLAYYVPFRLGELGDAAGFYQHIAAQLEQPFGTLYAAAPLLLIPEAVRTVRSIARSEPLRFDPRLRVVRRGDRHLAAFSDIRVLQVETVPGKKPRYTLCALLPGERRLEIRSGGNRARIDALAERIATVLRD